MVASRQDCTVALARGPEDPRLCDVDERFRQVLVDLTTLVKASRLSRERAFHGGRASGVAGVLQVLDDPDLPAHSLFRPGSSYPLVARYSNAGGAADDLSPTMRGCTLRLLDPERPSDLDAGLLDLPMNTGECFFAASAEVFTRFTTRPQERAELAATQPRLRELVWDTIRAATSYAAYEYYSQVPRGFVDRAGRTWLARYRLVPTGRRVEHGRIDPGGHDLPPDGPLPRPAGDPRPPDFLQQDLRSQVLGSGVDALLQIQLHPVPGSAAGTDAALDPTRPWPVDRYRWRDLARVRFDRLVDRDAIERVRFNPGAGPADLGIVLSGSPDRPASLNHLRVLVYRMAAAARAGDRLPADLAALLRPPAAEPAGTAAPAGLTGPAGAAPAGGGPAAAARVSPRPKAPGGPRTVCVVGAGPAGLSAARELERAGHRAIVLEAGAEVGGKCESVDIGGRAYDLGGHVCTTQYQRLAGLVTELGLATEDTTPHRVYELATGRSAPQDSSFFRRETYQRYAALRAEQFPRIAEPGLAHSAQALAAPVAGWLAEHGLQALARSLGVGYTAAGYGHLHGDLPALYFVKYVEMTGLLSSRPELLGHAGSFTITGGFQTLWQRVAGDLRDVRRGVRISAIKRHEHGVLVHLDGEPAPVEADDLLVTVPLGRLLPVLDSTATERELAARVRAFDYRTTVCTATGLPRSAFYLVQENTRPQAGRGRLVSFHHRYPDRDEYACYSYGTGGYGPGDGEWDGDGRGGDGLGGDGPGEDWRGPDGRGEDAGSAVAGLAADIELAGGRLEQVHLHRPWAFMPHFGSADLAAGVYDRLEAMQGERRTFHAGGLPSFELVECTVGYAQDLVRRHFPPLPGSAAGQPAAAPTVPGGGAPPAGEAAAAEPVFDLAGLRGWLVSRVAVDLQLAEAEVDPHAPLERYALDSLSTAALLAELSDLLGYRVAPTLLFELPTLDAVARELAGPARPAEPAPTRAATAGEPAAHRSKLILGLTPIRPLFCIGGVLGAAYYLRPLARALGAACHFYGLQAPGYDGQEEPLEDIPAIAARYLAEIREAFPYGPYLLAGHSFGGLVAYEMGRQLLAAGEEVARVILLDTYVPLPGQQVPPPDDEAAVTELLTMSRLTYTAQLHPQEPVEPELSERQRRDELAMLLGGTGSLPVEEQLGSALEVYQANLAATVRYQPPAADLPVVLVKALGGFPVIGDGDRHVGQHLAGPQNGWERLGLPDLEVVPVPGNHFNMMSDAYVQGPADALRRCLTGTVRRTG
jgi:thioesterase domain-containing protein/acyl carrier protein